MAYDNCTKVYLGYEDEYVTDKHRSLLNFTTNKIGGYPVSRERLIFARITVSPVAILNFSLDRSAILIKHLAKYYNNITKHDIYINDI